MLIDTHVQLDAITRKIITFRERCNSRYRRSDETHRLQLYRPADVLAQLRGNGFTARILPSGYCATTLPRGLTAYIARRRRSIARAEAR